MDICCFVFSYLLAILENVSLLLIFHYFSVMNCGMFNVSTIQWRHWIDIDDTYSTAMRIQPTTKVMMTERERLVSMIYNRTSKHFMQWKRKLRITRLRRKLRKVGMKLLRLYSYMITYFVLILNDWATCGVYCKWNLRFNLFSFQNHKPFVDSR